jgi:quercetin dioxygenase-like cupin family protein
MLHLSPGGGQRVDLGGALVRMLVGPAHTEGRFAFIEAVNAPGWSSELNRHPHQTKLFFVLAGSYDCYGDGRWLTAAAGDTLVVPAGTVHGFRAGPDGGRVLIIYPGDSAGWFAGADDHTTRGVESLGPLAARVPTN